MIIIVVIIMIMILMMIIIKSTRQQTCKGNTGEKALTAAVETSVLFAPVPLPKAVCRVNLRSKPHMYIYIYIYIQLSLYTYIYIYIYIQRCIHICKKGMTDGSYGQCS